MLQFFAYRVRTSQLWDPDAYREPALLTLSCPLKSTHASPVQALEKHQKTSPEQAEQETSFLETMPENVGKMVYGVGVAVMPRTSRSPSTDVSACLPNCLGLVLRVAG